MHRFPTIRAAACLLFAATLGPAAFGAEPAPAAPPATTPQPAANPEPSRLVEAENPAACTATGRIDTLIYPRTVGRKIVLLHPGSRLTTVTEATNVSLILPPLFTTPGPRYGNFLDCRLQVRIDDGPWRQFPLATTRRETVIAENLSPGKHTIEVEPVDGTAGVDAFRVSDAPLSGFWGAIVAADYSELFTEARVDVYRDDHLVRTEYLGCPRTGRFELFGLPPGTYRLNFVAAGWTEVARDGLSIERPGQRVDIGPITLRRDPRSGGNDTQHRSGPRFGRSLSLSPGDSFRTLVNIPAPTIYRAQLRSRFKTVDLEVSDIQKRSLGKWNDVGEATFRLPEKTPFDMYDLELFFSSVAETPHVAGQAVCVRPPLPAAFHVAGCGHMNTWGQQTAEYLAKVAETAQLAGARTLLIANEVNPAYIAGALSHLRIPYVVTEGNHTVGRWEDFFGPLNRPHDDGPMRIVDFGRLPYEPWDLVDAAFRDRPTATNRIVVCYEGFAPIRLIRERQLDLLFDAHSDNQHADRAAFPPRTFHLRAPGQDTLRWMPMTHDGLADEVGAPADIPVLAVPRTGPARLRVETRFADDGTSDRQEAAITNEYAVEFPQGSVRLVLSRGTYKVTGGTIAQSFDSDDGTRTIVDVTVRLLPNSTTSIQATRRQ